MQQQQFWAGFWLTTVTAAIASHPVQAQTTEITAIELIPTQAGLELLVSTATELTPSQIFSFADGNTLIIELVNVQLQPGLVSNQTNPVEGIESVEFDPVGGDRLQILVTGQTGTPVADLVPTAAGLTVQVTPPSQASETDPPEMDSPEMVDEPDSDEEPLLIVVTATRTAEEAVDVPRSVTVIDREQLDQQINVSQNLNDILGRLVPGFGPSSDRAFTAASLRGRTASILIDGVPLNVNNRDFDRELRTISPNAIERIEVVRGPSAIYGAEATGGIINIITRQPEDGELSLTSSIRATGALGDLDSDSLGVSLEQFVSARDGITDFTFSASIANPGNSFDAEGDLIPIIQGTDDSETVNIFGRFGFNFTDEQRLQISANYFQDERNTGIISDPIVDEIPGEQKARALDVGRLEFPDGGGPQADRNTLLNLVYSHDNILNSELTAQLYYRDNLSRADPRDRRPRAFGIFQGQLDSENWGGRLGMNTALSDDFNLLWGADYDQEESSNTFNLFDPDDFDASNGRVNRRIEERILVPPFNLESLGLFAQFQWQAADPLRFSGGVRYENVSMDVGDYTTFFGDFIEGGDKNFDDVLFNAGLVYDLSDNVSVFGSFAQGFTVPDFGLVLGFPDPGFSVDSDVTVNQPQKVDEFELGLRGTWNNVQASLSGFYNQSDLGSSFAFNEDTGFFDILRAPERVYGVEATLDAQIAEDWALGGTVSWSEGEADLEDDGNYTALSSARIQPIKLTAYIENETLPGWRNRLQGLLVGDRSDAFDDDIDPSAIESYFVLDLISSIEIGNGTLEIGIENLLDEQFFPAYSQRTSGFSETFNSAGRGRTLSIGYRLTW